MLDFIKKQWFLSLIAALLVGTILYYVYDQNKDNLPAKSVGGKDVVFSVAGTDVTTDEVYQDLYKQYGKQVVYMFFERAVVHASAETTDVMKTKAEVDIAGVKQNFSDYYGADKYESYLLDALKSMGYTSLEDLTDYFTYTYKLQDMLNAYVDEHLDTLYADFSVTNQPRVVSHVLIKMDDPNNPTADEKARFDAAKAALASGTSFEDLVAQYSDDTNTSANKGSLGYMDASTQYEENFLNAALALTQEGQLSDWTQTSYGFHLIRLDSMNIDSLKEHTEFYNAILTANPLIQPSVIWAKAKELNVDFLGDDQLKADIMDYMGVTEE